jgi:hypothetical protein
MGMSVSWLLSICKAVKFVSCTISPVSTKIREGEKRGRRGKEKREREEVCHLVDLHGYVCQLIVAICKWSDL